MPYRTTPPDDHVLSIDEFARLPAEDCWMELVRGRVVREPLPGFEHGALADELHSRLREFVHRCGLGRVVGRTGFLLFDDPPTVRGPDVAFVAAERIRAHGVPRGFWPGAPDLAVEVASPAKARRGLHERVDDYLMAGARLVWVVDPRVRTVTVYAPGTTARVYGGGADVAPPGSERDVLLGGDVLPGFRLSVAGLFAATGLD
ncbi:MAG: Uma2 family endonuclease [bacterium]|jgi:Uma2 family endonuclease|nr:MAG: Uma2 family endonuclease [bacterium]